MCIMPVLGYGCQTWVPTKEQTQRLKENTICYAEECAEDKNKR